MRKIQKKYRKLLKNDENCIIIEVHPNNVKKITIELDSATPSDQSDIVVINNGQALKIGEIKNISDKEIKGIEKDKKEIMCRASELAKYTINRCLELEIRIDTPKLQKLLVIMQGEYLMKYNEAFFVEPIEVWDCGVAIKRVNCDFKSYVFGITEKQECYLALLDREKDIIHSVIDKYGKKDVFELNQDNRLLLIKDKYFEDRPIEVPRDFIRKVFIDNDYMD